MATNQKPISKSLTDSDKLLKLSWKAKCFYIFQKLHSDNLATIKANPYFLKGELYPKDDSITPEIIKEIIKECVEAGLLIHYKNNGIEYLHDPQAGNHEKIVGNMSEKGEYPLPEKQQITAWEQRFNGVYTQIYRKKPFKTQKIGKKNGEKPLESVNTPSKSVYTPLERVNTPLKSVNTPSKSVSPEDRRLKIEDRRLKIEDKIFLSEFSNENYGRLVFLLRDLILQNNSKAKITNSQLKNWYKEVRLMVERDNRTLEEIEFVITKSQDDSFWKENILSMEKLREKFDQLWIKFKNENIGFRGRKLSEADKAFKKQLEEEGY